MSDKRRIVTHRPGGNPPPNSQPPPPPAPPVNEGPACGNCRFGSIEPQSGQILCHRYPPQVFLMEIPNQNPGALQLPGRPQTVTVTQAIPPALSPQFWCGEHEEKVAP